MRARDAAWTPFPSYLSPVPDGLRKVLPPAEEQPRAAENGENGEGYRRVRVGVRGRLPILHTRAHDDLPTRQKYELRYREKHRAKLHAYHREYYRKKRTFCDG